MLDKLITVSGIIGTLLGTLVGGVLGFAGAWLREKFETKRQLRELITKVAMEDWNKQIELYKGTGKKLMPLDAYMIHYLMILESIDKNTTVEDLKKILRKSNNFSKGYLEITQEFNDSMKTS